MRVGNAIALVPDADTVRGGLLGLTLDLHGAVDADGCLRYVNAALARALGSTEAALLGTPLAGQLTPADREAAARCLEQARGQGAPVDWEGRCTTAGGESIVAWRACLQPETGFVLLVGRDVTDVRRSEEELRTNQRLLRAVFDTIPHSLVAKDRDSNLLMGNAAWSRRFGYRHDQLVGRNTMDIETRPQADREHTLALDRAVIEGDRDRMETEFERTAIDGSRRTFRNWRSRLRDDKGQVLGLVSMSEDITERRADEQALLDSERRFRNIVEGSIQGILVLRGRRPVFANESYARMFGYGSAAEILALESVDGLVAPRDCVVQTEYGKARLRGEPVPEQYEFEGVHRDGSQLWLQCIVRLVDWEGAPAFQCTLLDITERKRAEENLRANERLLQTVFDTVPHHIFVKDLQGRFVMANRAMADCHGLRPEQVIGRRLSDLPGPTAEERAVLRSTDQEVLASGGVREWPAVNLTTAAGDPRIHRVQKTLLHGEDGQVQGIVCVSEDLTERRRAENVARASQRLLRLVVDALPHNIHVKDRERRFVMANRAMAAFHQRTPEEMVGLTVQELPSLRPQEREALDAMDRQVLQTGRLLDLPDVPISAADGRVTHQHMHKLPLRNDAGEIEGIVVISVDVTEHRRAEQELRASQRLLQTVIDTMPSLIAVKDPQRRYVMVNKAWTDLRGLSAEQVVGRTLGELEVRPPEVTAAVERMDDAILRDGEPYWEESFTHTLPDGSHQHFLNYRAPLRDETGAVSGVVAAAMDVTLLKQVEEELRASRQLLQTVFDVIPLWVFVKDRERRLVMVNRRMAEDHGFTPQEAVRGRPRFLSPALSAEQIARYEAIDERVLGTGQAMERASLPSTLTDGQMRNYRTIRVPLRDDSGQVVGLVGISEDVTERERAQRAVQQAQKLESLGVLAGGIAHDFNNLLVSVLGYAHLAATELPPDSPVQPLVRQIETAGRRAGDLCAQMLAYAGKGSFQVSRVYLNQLIHEMTELIRVSLSRNIRLQFDFDEDLPVLEVDATQLRQVVMNLIINASEAIAERPGAIMVRTSVREVDAAMLDQFVADPDLSAGRYVCLEVADTGNGMEAETLQRIFDPFFTTKFSGRGLGLAAVLGIVRGHQGALRVASTPGAGTTFTVLLPFGKAPAEVPEAPPTPAICPGGSGTVVVADDEAAICDLIRFSLERQGYAVTTVGDGEAALEAARGLGASLRAVILDVTMPGMSTGEVLRRLQAEGVTAPVIVMSGHAESEVRERTDGLPVAAYLTKPFTGADLQRRLESALNGETRD